jgi:hypothetical protein
MAVICTTCLNVKLLCICPQSTFMSRVWGLCLPPAFTEFSYSAYSSTLKMETICSSVTTVEFQRTTRGLIPACRPLHRIILRINIYIFSTPHEPAGLCTVKAACLCEAEMNTWTLYKWSWDYKELTVNRLEMTYLLVALLLGVTFTMVSTRTRQISFLWRRMGSIDSTNYKAAGNELK